MKPIITPLDDGSVLIEWIRPGERWGLALERTLSESGWYHVSAEGANESGHLQVGDIMTLAELFAKNTKDALQEPYRGYIGTCPSCGNVATLNQHGFCGRCDFIHEV